MAYLNGNKVLFSPRITIAEGIKDGIRFWEPGKVYNVGDIVYKPHMNDGMDEYDILARCLVKHTSDAVFATDIYENEYWEYVKGVEAVFAEEAVYAAEAGAAECDNEGRVIHETYPTWEDMESGLGSTYTDLYDILEMSSHFWEYSMEEAEEYLYDATEILLILKKSGSDKLIYSHYVPFNNDYGCKTVGYCAHQKVSIMNDTNAYWYYDGSKICLENADGYTIESIMLKY